MEYTAPRPPLSKGRVREGWMYFTQLKSAVWSFIAVAKAVKTYTGSNPESCDRETHAQTLQLRPSSEGYPSYKARWFED